MIEGGSDVVEETGGALGKLLVDPELGARFAQLDLTQLRGREWTTTMAPPGWISQSTPESNSGKKRKTLRVRN